MIDMFTGGNFFLSNFYKCNVEYEGLIYPSSEAAYQAQKNPSTKKIFTIIEDPDQTKKIARFLPIREDWNEKKDQIMEDIVRNKFRNNPQLALKLLDTADQELIEGNVWHDNYWGNCECEECKDITGLNKLGNILMKIRKELNEENISGE